MKQLSLIFCHSALQSDHPDSVHHTATCLNFLSRQLHLIHREHDTEILVCDWIPHQSLQDSLPLDELARQICTFVQFPPSLREKLTQSTALNACLRRAQGKYLATISSNVLIPAYSLRSFYRISSGELPIPLDLSQTFFYFNHHEIPQDKVGSAPSISEWETYILQAGSNLPLYFSGFGLGSPSIGYLAHRSIWEEMRGFHELCSNFTWANLEIALRASQVHPLESATGLGFRLFSTNHLPEDPLRLATASTHPNDQIVSKDFCPNPPEWGLLDTNILISPSNARVPLQSSSKRPSTLPDSDTLLQILNGNVIKDNIKSYFEDCSEVQKIGTSMGIEEKVHLELMCYLAWFSLYFSPRTFYYYGSDCLNFAGIVAKNSPSTTIYAINPWKNSEYSSWGYPSRLAATLSAVKHRGYVRHVSGNPDTAHKRLLHSILEPLQIDLALINTHVSVDDSCKQIERIAPYLSSSSMLVIQSESFEQTQRIIEQASSSLLIFSRKILTQDSNSIFLKD